MAEVKLHEIEELAREVLKKVEPRERAFVIFLQGELGAGKTTFMQAFAKEIGIMGTVQSPTYVLMRRYDISYRSKLGATFTSLIHIDAYRLDEPKQFKDIKPEEFLHNPQTIVCIEWPERIHGELPKPDVLLRFGHTRKEDAREVAIEVE